MGSLNIYSLKTKVTESLYITHLFNLILHLELYFSRKTAGTKLKYN